MYVCVRVSIEWGSRENKGGGDCYNSESERVERGGGCMQGNMQGEYILWLHMVIIEFLLPKAH